MNGIGSLRKDYNTCFLLWLTILTEDHIQFVWTTESIPQSDEFIYHIVLDPEYAEKNILYLTDSWNAFLQGLKLPEDENVELAFIGTDNIKQCKRFIKPFLDQDFS